MPDETKDISNVPNQTAPQDAGQASPENANVDQAVAQANPAQASPESATADQAVAQAKPQVQTPKPGPTPADVHQSLFRNIFEGLAGGPTKYTTTDPVTGKVTQQSRPLTKGKIASSILAGAISGMLAGEMSPDKLNDNGRRDLSGSAAAGSQAAAAIPAQRNAQAQGLADKQQSAQIAATDHNLKTHAAILNNMKLQGDVMQSAVDDAAPVLKAMEDAQASLPNAQLIKKSGVTEDELQKMMADGSAHVTRDSVFPDGKTDVYDKDGKQVMNPDGSPKQVYTYTIYDHNGAVAMTDDIRARNPELVNVPNGQSLPIKVLAKLATQRNQTENAQGFVTDFQKRLADLTGKKDFTPIDLKSEIQKDPLLKGLTPILGRYAGMEPDKALAAMRQDKVDPNLIGRFQKLLNIDESGLAEKRALDQRELQKKQDLENKKQESDLTLAREEKMADYKKKLDISADEQAVSNTKSFPHEWVDTKTGNHWDLTDTVMNTVDGGEDPSQMSKRGKGDQYRSDLKLANAYSQARYGKNFDMAQAQSDYKYANQKSTQDTIKLLQSLTGEDNKNNGGTLKQLETDFDALGNLQIPKVNNVFNWLSENVGRPGVTNMQATLLGVADEYGKILGGGVATDSSRNEAKETINKAFSEQQGKGALARIRGTLANRQNALVGSNRYLTKQYGKMDHPQGVAGAGSANVPDHKKAIMDAITFPGGGKPADVKFGPQGQVIVWSGKPGDGWVDVTSQVKQ